MLPVLLRALLHPSAVCSNACPPACAAPASGGSEGTSTESWSRSTTKENTSAPLPQTADDGKRGIHLMLRFGIGFRPIPSRCSCHITERLQMDYRLVTEYTWMHHGIDGCRHLQPAASLDPHRHITYDVQSPSRDPSLPSNILKQGAPSPLSPTLGNL
jgi:hypothetical protein